MQLPLDIPLFRSRQLAGLLAFVHLAALAILWPLEFAPIAKSLLAMGIAGSAGLSIGRIWRHRIVALRLLDDGKLEVATKLGAGGAATVLPQTVILPGLIILLLRIGGRGERLVLPTDATGAAAHRQLRLWLRWRVSATSG